MTTNEIITERLEPYFSGLKNTTFEISDEKFKINGYTQETFYTFNLSIKTEDPGIFSIVTSLIDLFSCYVSDVSVNKNNVFIRNCELN